MEQQFEALYKTDEFALAYGKEVVMALIILVGGLLLTRLFVNLLRRVLMRFTDKAALVSTIGICVHVILIIFIVAIALNVLGLHTLVVRRILLAVILAAVGLLIILRPYIPTLPFRVGNTIMTGDLLGKVEATTMLNTRLRTFDGKTVFVPNSKILNDYLINYHFTPNRRFEIDVGIGYDQDLLKAKRVLEELIVADPRVLETPRPIVYVTKLADSCV